MDDLSNIEKNYKKYIKNMNKWLPEGIIDVDLALLQKMDLLHYYDSKKRDPKLTRYFQVFESEEKITLINESFVVWIVPDKVGFAPLTYTLIALNPANPHLELVYTTSGAYNSSSLVLSVLEKFLEEIEENEELIHRFNKVI